jgi:putative DNA primase/helicase
MLHTDNAEMIFEAARPIILNGIPSLTDRADLADRALTVHLKAIPEHERRPEDELLAEFEEARPRIIGALCDAVSAALRNVDKVKIERSPRMADFVKWITAAETGLGWEPGEFLAAYNKNRKDVSETVFEADSVAVAIKNFVTNDHPMGWEGTPTELLTEINNRVPEGIRKARSWPMTAQALGNRIDRIAPLLRNKGFVIERMRSTVRTIKIIPPSA